MQAHYSRVLVLPRKRWLHPNLSEKMLSKSKETNYTCQIILLRHFSTENCRPKLQACSGKMNESSLIQGMEEGGMMMPGYEGAGTPPPDMGAPPPGMGSEMEMGSPPTPYNMVPMQMAIVCG